MSGCRLDLMGGYPVATARNQQGIPDDTEPTPARQGEIQALASANVQSGHPPYRGAVIRSRGELLWILGAHDSAVRGTASGSEVQILGEESVPIDLQGADLRGVVLPGVDLREANLGGASFRDATLVGANL